MKDRTVGGVLHTSVSSILLQGMWFGK